MRLYPVLPITGRKSLAADSILGLKIPAGSTVVFSAFASQRHPEFWEEPDTFNPDRFDQISMSTLHPGSYFPFGLGPRSCLGNGLGMIQLSAYVTEILNRNRLELPPGFEPKVRARITMGIESLPLLCTAIDSF